MASDAAARDQPVPGYPSVDALYEDLRALLASWWQGADDSVSVAAVERLEAAVREWWAK